ncbi:hypothetical protein SLS56_009917 [Neofusicoccum ribis]|uniref:Uncharacterized protein n=1 Tax=Neofusicoccum ribis TaxID=45134 RepID=A0ABR3SG19_9PEZI
MADAKAFRCAFEQVERLRFDLECATRHVNELSRSLQTESHKSGSLHTLASRAGRKRKTFNKKCGYVSSRQSTRITQTNAMEPISILWRALKIEPRTDQSHQDIGTEGNGVDCDNGDEVMDIMDIDGPSQPELSTKVSHRPYHPPVDVDVIRKTMNDKRIKQNARRREREKRRMGERLTNCSKYPSADQLPPTPKPQVVYSHENQPAVLEKQQESFCLFGQQTVIERGYDDNLEDDPRTPEITTIGNLAKPLGALAIDKFEHEPSFNNQ